MTESLSSLKGMKGGEKQKWLRVHRPEILAYLEANGELATRERFNIKKDIAWERFCMPNARQPKTFTKADRAISIAEIARADATDAKRRNRELEDKFNQLIPLLAEQITEKFFKPLLTGKIEFPPDFEDKPRVNPLAVSNYLPKLAKEADNPSNYVMSRRSDKNKI